MTVIIRSAMAEDVKAMHQVRNMVRENRLSDPAAITELSYLRFINCGSAWVAEAGARIVGFAAIDASCATVWALFVHPHAQGAGVGQALHVRMLDWARGEGIRRLFLSTEEGSRAAMFYRRAGWTQIGITAEAELRFERSL